MSVVNNIIGISLDEKKQNKNKNKNKTRNIFKECSDKIDSFSLMPSEDKAIFFHKTRRHIHQIDLYNFENYINTRIDYAEIGEHKKRLYFLCMHHKKGYTCKKRIYLDNILKNHPLMHNKKMINKFRMKILNIQKRVIYCPNKKCILKDGVILKKTPTKKIYQCKLCDDSWCLRCDKNHKENELCNDQIQEKETNKYLENNTQKCPTCRFRINKEYSCDHVRCRCGTYFCYVCGVKLPGNYKEHLVYSDDKFGTYVCPKRLEKKRSGLADSVLKEVENNEDLEEFNLSEDDDDEIQVPINSDPENNDLDSDNTDNEIEHYNILANSLSLKELQYFEDNNIPLGALF